MIGAALDALQRVAWPTGPGAFRLWLALLVFVHHMSSFGVGPFAVYVFFALSGYWLQLMWTGRYRKAQHAYLTYLASRFWRLAPMMVLANVLTVPFLMWIGVGEGTVLAEPLHLAISSVVMLGYAWLDYLPVGAAWSLDVEAQFYVLLPLLAALVLRGPGIAWLALAASISLAAALWLDTPPTLAQHLFFFAAGMLAARHRWEPGVRAAYASAALVVGVLIFLTVSPWAGIVWGGADKGPLFVWNPVLNVALSVAALPFALWTVRRRSDGIDRAFGDLSYIVYMLHWAAMQWFFTLEGSVMHRLPYAAAAFLVIGALSLAVWYAFDRPINAARTRWVAARTAG